MLSTLVLVHQNYQLLGKWPESVQFSRVEIVMICLTLGQSVYYVSYQRYQKNIHTITCMTF